MTPAVDVVDDVLRLLILDVVLLDPGFSPSSNPPAIVQVLGLHYEVNPWVLLGVNHTDHPVAASGYA